MIPRHLYVSEGIGQCGMCGFQRGGEIHTEHEGPAQGPMLLKQPRTYDLTVARMAGNIAAGLVVQPRSRDNREGSYETDIADTAVRIARLIIGRTIATEPVAEAI